MIIRLSAVNLGLKFLDLRMMLFDLLYVVMGPVTFCCSGIADTAAFLLPLYSFAFWGDPPFGDKLCIHLKKRFVCEFLL